VRTAATGELPAPEPKAEPAFGLLIGSATVTDGTLSAEVEFEGAITPATACELAVACDPNALHVVSAGIGGESWGMFSIREFGGPQTTPAQWWIHRIGGDRANLKPGIRYRVEARFRGDQVTLLIDNVAIGTAQVGSPLGLPRQAGLFCRAEHPVVVRNFTIESLKPKAFVVMQFSGEYDDMYHDVVKEICKDYQVNALRADEVSGPGLIVGDVIREISESQLIIADITPANPNVYFEIGYALALKKPTVLLAKKGTPLPFDVAGFRVLFYEDTIGGKSRMEENLRRHLDAILEK
jgi:hypothetical protein